MAVKASSGARGPRVGQSGQNVTIRDVALRAGVSLGTVSRCLNKPDTVRPATLVKVRAAIADLGFRPDSSAQNMRRRSTMTVGFVVDDISNPLHAETFRAVDDEMRRRGFSVYLVQTNGNAVDEAAAVDMLQHGRADGVIMTLNNEREARTLRLLGEMRIPSVLLDRDIPLAIDAVLTDHATGLRAATRYLLGLGHRRIALVTGSEDIRPGRERVQGFLSAFAEAGLPAPRDLVRAESLSADFGFRETSQLLDGPDRPTALIAAGNRILVGALRAIQGRDVAVPGNLSLISCDQTDVARLYPGPITLVERDLREIGRTAAQLLLDRLTGPSERPVRRIVVPTRLMLGGSCAPHSGAGD